MKLTNTFCILLLFSSAAAQDGPVRQLKEQARESGRFIDELDG